MVGPSARLADHPTLPFPQLYVGAAGRSQEDEREVSVGRGQEARNTGGIVEAVGRGGGGENGAWTITGWV